MTSHRVVVRELATLIRPRVVNTLDTRTALLILEGRVVKIHAYIYHAHRHPFARKGHGHRGITAVDEADARHLARHIGLQFPLMAYVHAENAVHLGDSLHLVERHLHDGLLPNAAPDGHTQFSHTGVCVGSMLVCHFYDERQHRLLCRRHFHPSCRLALHLGFLLRQTNHRVSGHHTLRLYSQRIRHQDDGHHPLHYPFHSD